MKRWNINKNLPKIFEKQKQDKLSQFSFKNQIFSKVFYREPILKIQKLLKKIWQGASFLVKA